MGVFVGLGDSPAPNYLSRSARSASAFQSRASSSICCRSVSCDMRCAISVHSRALRRNSSALVDRTDITLAILTCNQSSMPQIGSCTIDASCYGHPNRPDALRSNRKISGTDCYRGSDVFSLAERCRQLKVFAGNLAKRNPWADSESMRGKESSPAWRHGAARH